MKVTVNLFKEDECRGCSFLCFYAYFYLCHKYKEILKVLTSGQKDENLVIKRLEICKKENG